MQNLGRVLRGINDFLPRYAQARMIGSSQVYEIEAGYREQERAAGTHMLGAYNDRLPWQALLMARLGRLPYLTAYWIWMGLNLACFAALVYVWLLPRDYVLWGVVFLPVAASIILGQEGVMLALCLAGAVRCADTRRDLAAGFLLALCTAKPHLFLLVPVVLIARRRWRIVGSAVAATVGLLAIGTAAAGLDWPLHWWAVLKTLSRESDPGHGLARCPSLFQFGMNGVTLALALTVAAVFGALIWRSRTLEAGIAIAVIGGILIAPHTAIYDLPLLLVALPVLPLAGWTRWIRIGLLTPLPYLALLRAAPWNAVLPVMLLGCWGSTERKTGLTLPEFCGFREPLASGDILQGVGRIAKGSKLAPHHGVRNREGIAPQ
jgi:hypothetical protein